MPAPNTLLLDLRFGLGAAAGDLQYGAWSGPEDGHCWALSAPCGIELPVADNANDAVVLLDVWPLIATPARPTRTMQIYRDGRCVSVITVGRRGCFCVPIGSVRADVPAKLDFVFDPAVEPEGDDTRPMAFGFRSLRLVARTSAARVVAVSEKRAALDFLGMDGAAAQRHAAVLAGEPLRTFLCHFESLGQSCDFGIFQRQCGAEPLGLLRFGSAPTHGLVDGLVERFALLGVPGTLETVVVKEWNDEYFMYDRSYGLTWHTFLTPAEASPEQLIAREDHRLPFLKRGFLKVLDGATKVFVLRRSDEIRPDEAEAVAAALRLHADCRLLWAIQDDGEPGSVEALSSTILLGHLDIAERRGSASLQSWLSICVNAAAMFGVGSKTP